jgi:hypothetical protein
MAGKKTDKETMIVLDKIDYRTIIVPIEGVTDLIVHRFSFKSMLEMLEKQMDEETKRTGKKPKIPKNPTFDYEETLYWLSEKPEYLLYNDLEEYKTISASIKGKEERILKDIENGKFGFPAGGFKAAMVGGCRLTNGIAMTEAKTLFSVSGITNYELVEIEGSKPLMRSDAVRLESGVADIRFRATFKNWKASLKIEYIANRISADSVVNLVNYAGVGGIGEWRPTAKKSASGDFGRFRVNI